MTPGQVFYAIGDIHGEAARLARLHALIRNDAERNFRGQRVTLVHLGDYVDRGRDSAGAIELVRALERDSWCDCVSLRGNHEQMMIDALADEQSMARLNWLRNGGEQTLESYRDEPDGRLQEHIDWLKGLPSLHADETGRFIFVHAGINPDTFPGGDEIVHLWTRSARFFDSERWTNPRLSNVTVVHGHTPTPDARPDQSLDGRRINLDTGAVYGGALTAAVLQDGQPPRFLHA